MVLIDLFISFLKIGFTSFGGLSMIPLITSEMTVHQWMTAAEVSDIVAIAEMTPGPLGLNCATFAGLRTAGLLGAIAANLGALMPAFTLTMVAAIFFEKFRKSHIMLDVLTGVRPACVGMIFGVLVPMIVGPFLGAAVIRGGAGTYEELGVVKNVPTPAIFLTAAAVLLTALLLRRAERRRA